MDRKFRERVRLPLAALAAVLLFGTLGYVDIEGWIEEITQGQGKA